MFRDRLQVFVFAAVCLVATAIWVRILYQIAQLVFAGMERF